MQNRLVLYKCNDNNKIKQTIPSSVSTYVKMTELRRRKERRPEGRRHQAVLQRPRGRPRTYFQ